jgi:RNA polymerase sigma-70 factor (ECF subfamily)
VFTLSVVEEMDAAEICQQLGITLSNYWVRMHRARLGLAACVSKQWERESS